MSNSSSYSGETSSGTESGSSSYSSTTGCQLTNNPDINNYLNQHLKKGKSGTSELAAELYLRDDDFYDLMRDIVGESATSREFYKKDKKCYGQAVRYINNNSSNTRTFVILHFMYSFLATCTIFGLTLGANSMLLHECGPGGTWDNTMARCNTTVVPPECQDPHSAECSVPDMEHYEKYGGRDYGLRLIWAAYGTYLVNQILHNGYIIIAFLTRKSRKLYRPWSHRSFFITEATRRKHKIPFDVNMESFVSADMSLFAIIKNALTIIHIIVLISIYDRYGFSDKLKVITGLILSGLAGIDTIAVGIVQNATSRRFADMM